MECKLLGVGVPSQVLGSKKQQLKVCKNGIGKSGIKLMWN